MIFSLFSQTPTHPLADVRELKRVVGGLPTDDAFKACDDVVGWFESLQNADRLPADVLFGILRQLDDAGQSALRRLSRDYLMAPRLTRRDEQRYWTVCSDYWSRLAALSFSALRACLDAAAGSPDKGAVKAAAALKADLPLLAARAVAAQSMAIKWSRFRYGPVDAGVWGVLGHGYLAAAHGGFADKPVQLYPQTAGLTTVALEYLKAIVLEASSLDSLLPVDIELAEKLVSHFLPSFVLSAELRNDNLYWIDPAAGQPPRRLAATPPASPTLRLIALGSAPAQVARLIALVEGGQLPPEINLGGQFAPKRVLAVLRHLALYWAPQPPVRQHPRHPVKSRMTIIKGFADCVAGCGQPAAAGVPLAESWVVENVSLGGFGTAIDNLRDASGVPMKIGALLCMQPQGGENWLIGVVRRLGKDSATTASAGIETIARQPRPLSLRLRAPAAYASGEPVPAIALLDGPGEDAPELRLALPPATFDVRESYETTLGGRVRLLSPLELVETGPDYELARYRVLTATPG